MTDMTDRVAVITGGSAGIGLATAHELTRRGARVIILGRNQETLDAAVAELGDTASSIVADVTDSGQLTLAIDSIGETYGRIDILVANAGGGGGGPLATLTDQDFTSIFDLNTRSVMTTIKHALPHMPAGSSVVVTISVAATQATAGMALYSGAKAAVRAMVRAWAIEAKDQRVRMNLVSPSAVDTDNLRGALAEMLGADNVQTQLDAMAERTLTGRISRPADIAATIAFLASDAATQITGTEIVVDGGASLL